MREIKFRAWDKEYKEMFSVELIGWNKHGILEIESPHNCYIFSEKQLVLMQFTGLLDKNGKEIYEGDIVEVDRRIVSGFERGWVKVRFEILFEYCKWNGKVIKKPCGNDVQQLDLFLTHNSCEIIGNIYENPELLEEKNEEN